MFSNGETPFPAVDVVIENEADGTSGSHAHSKAWNLGVVENAVTVFGWGKRLDNFLADLLRHRASVSVLCPYAMRIGGFHRLSISVACQCKWLQKMNMKEIVNKLCPNRKCGSLTLNQ